MPDLMKIQNFVYYHKKNDMKNSDLVDDMIECIRAYQYSNELDDDKCFAFGYRIDESGSPVIGEGTDDDPRMIAVSTKTMLRKADRTSENFIFHMDATFKVITVEYPYEQALQQISEKFMQVAGKPLRIKHFMADAEDAQYNGYSLAVKHNDTSYLIHIYEMHYSTSYDEFALFKPKALTTWEIVPELTDFTAYFTQQWIESRYWKWQCYHSKSGLAKLTISVNNSTK
ncbi:Hypothetical protein PHPALM_19958 [Phytophthora palmivora]|uniref:Uncharacterized protein n=1 Tax=Phytophthora palmivora TaxID=4796 RepID=A0A2P4XG26_9STRA|nr:Hypothetical protein PHPALM_19958 [Phytophthora palmivora]